MEVDWRSQEVRTDDLEAIPGSFGVDADVTSEGVFSVTSVPPLVAGGAAFAAA